MKTDMACTRNRTAFAQKISILRRTLRERMKELKCIYSISDIVEEPDLTLSQILQRLAAIIPRAWQYPKICRARITVWGRNYASPDFRITRWRQSANVKCNGKRVGHIEVCYLKRAPQMDEGPFLKEERNLINVIAERIGKIVERSLAESAVRESVKQFRSLSSHLQRVREEERARIAHELCDELGQALTAIKIDLSCLVKKMPPSTPKLGHKVRLMRELIDHTIHSTQRICAELRPAMLDDLGLAPAILWQASEFQERTGVKCRVSISPDDIALSDEHSIALFRIFQEALTNVYRHASASELSVDLRCHDARVALTIWDNGRGITKGQACDPASFGIFGIRERVRQLGGKFSIEGRARKGTTLEVDIPLKTPGECI